MPFTLHFSKDALSKILSLMVALSYILINGILVEPAAGLQTAAGVTLPLACIWFADSFGGMTGGFVRLHMISNPTPPLLMHFAGWLLLIGIPLIAIIIRL